MSAEKVCILLLINVATLSSVLLAEEDLPTVAEVKERVIATAAKINTLQVYEETVRRQRDYNGGNEVYEMQRTCQWTLTDDGKRHYVSEGKSLRFTNTGATYVPYKTELSYDGKLSRSIDYLSRDITRTFSGKVDDHPIRHTMLPTEFTVFWQPNKSLLDILNRRPFHVLGHEVLNDRKAVVLLGEPIERDGWHWNRRIHFDMEWGTPLKTAYVMKQTTAEEWIEYAVWIGLDHQEMIEGVWLPEKYRKYSFNVKDKGNTVEFSDGYVGTYSNWKVNEEIPSTKFALVFPDNLPVNDLRPEQNGRLLSKEEIAELNQAARQK